MSMNLYWISPNGSQEEFPYQTRIDFSYKVMKMTDKEEILKIFEEDLKDHAWCYRKEYMREIKNKLKLGYKFGICRKDLYDN